jgi:cytochrome c5
MKLSLCGYVAASLFILTSGAQAAGGEAIYTANCAGCHQMMPPKTGDKAAWAPLIKQGTDVLVANVVKGKGMMPARGGHANLTDADIKAAVEFMETKSK